MLREIGFCSGIENYSRVLSGRALRGAPFTLIDYFPKDYLLFVDESHVTLPQVRGMYGGDRARNRNLVEFGFRLPSAYDNRPLNYNEFLDAYKSGDICKRDSHQFEKGRSSQIVEQVKDHWHYRP